MRRTIAGLMHRFAWWLDRRADDIWNIDEFLSPARCSVCHVDTDGWDWCTEDDPRCRLPKPVVRSGQ